ncbi:YcbJ family phosphotransferase [Sodalis sp.]|uniref:YcbJ family phosphotransferase n=1 Tax=Sodalis sp. (in: enterobacteria) TaxID=1898979 RepID=UPI003872E02E
MEQLRVELSAVLGEPLSRLERISEQPYAHLYAMYDREGHALSLVAKSYVCPGIAQQEAYKLSMLAREGEIRLPTVYGLILSQHPPYKELLLMERLRGVPVEAPTRTPERWQRLQEQIVDGILAWHRIDSHGLVGIVDSTQENRWPAWYSQRIEVIWSTLSKVSAPLLSHDDRVLLFRTRQCLPRLFDDFNEGCVLVHGNLSLRSMLKDPRSDQLLAMLNPGTVLWAPREYDLSRLSDEGMSEALLFHYLSRAPVAEAFLCRRWLYAIWEAAARYIHTGQLDHDLFVRAGRELIPWLD